MIRIGVVDALTRLFLAAVLIVTALSNTLGCAPAQADRSPRASESLTLQFDPDPILVGVIKPGESRSLPLTITNPSSEAVEVKHVESSCECVLVDPPVTQIPPGQSVRLSAIVCPEETSNFQGTLSVILIARAPGNRIVGQGRVNLTVFR